MEISYSRDSSLGCNNTAEEEDKKRQTKTFKIAEELMLSERVFVDVLKLLDEDFRQEILNANLQQGQVVVPDNILNQILNYLPQLRNFNENLLQDLIIRIRNWNKNPRIADIIIKKGPFLKLYTSYIKEFELMISTFDVALKKYGHFAQVVKTFEMNPRCKGLALRHYMLKPIQRIPQYKLLLENYVKHLAEDSLDYTDAHEALKIVSEVADHVNDSIKQRETLEKMVELQNRLQGYEIIKPGRVLLKEENMLKLSRKGLQPRKFFLFNDCLMYATLTHDTYYKVNHELPLIGMQVNIPNSEDFDNEFSILSMKRSITVSVQTSQQRDEWIEALHSAIKHVTTRKISFVRLRSNAADGEPSDIVNLYRLGDHAPLWIPDARVTMCHICLSEFKFTVRRHHCRACGKIICNDCSKHRSPLPYINNQLARVCDECHETLNPEEVQNEVRRNSDSSLRKMSNIASPTLRKLKYVPKILKEVSACDKGAEVSGYLQKKKNSGWKKYWFVLKENVLYTYKASQDCAALESIPILGYSVNTLPNDASAHSFVFELVHEGQTPVKFSAENEKNYQRWVKALQNACIL